MRKFTDNLSRVRVAAPCPADWDAMIGDERKRFCGECRMSVYNLSNMSRRDAEALVVNAEGRLCVRFYRRRDGSILTANCPNGVRALKRRASLLARAALSSVLSFFAGVGVCNGLLKIVAADAPPPEHAATVNPPVVDYAAPLPEAALGRLELVAGEMSFDEPETARGISSKKKKSIANRSSEDLSDH